MPFYADETAYWTTTSYDALDRPITMTHPGGKTATRAYGLGLVTSTDENGNQQTERMNVYGQVIEHRERLDSTWYTTYSKYDVRGQLSEITDPVGNKTYITHDSLGRRIQMSDPDTGTWVYDYDARAV